MIVYRVQVEFDDFVNYFHGESDERIRAIADVEPLTDGWTPIKVKVWTRDEDESRERPFPNIGSLHPYAPVFDEKAVRALKHLFGKVELLPVDVCGATHWIVHFLEQPRCLDTEASEIMWSRATPSPAHIFKYVFRPECVAGRHLFQVPETHGLALYASDEFKRQVEKAKLTGVGFKEIWRSDEPA